MLKKALYLLPLALVATACSNDEPDGPDALDYTIRTLTFEDADAKFAPYSFAKREDVNIATWSDLIDKQQYNGPLLYNDATYTGYAWADGGNTELSGCIIGDGPFWNGGHAVSNYYLSDLSNVDYTMQLAVCTGSEGAAGHNGSRNFAVHNGYTDDKSYKDKLPALSFADGVARVVDHMYVTNTAYTYAMLQTGNAYCAPAGDNSWFKIIAYGYDAAGEQTGSEEFFLCKGKASIVNSWTKWDLSALGEVVRIEFNIDGSADLRGEWGLNTPAYFAYDDVAVRFPKL